MILKLLLLASTSFILLRVLLLKRWSRTQCPSCGHSFLIRTKRSLREHIFSSFLVAPLRRYQCQFYSCRWRGLAYYPRRSNIKAAKTERINSNHGNAKQTEVAPTDVKEIEVKEIEVKEIEVEQIKLNDIEAAQVSTKYFKAEPNDLGYVLNQPKTQAKELEHTEASHSRSDSLQSPSLQSPSLQSPSLQSPSLYLRKPLPLLKPPLSFVIAESKEIEESSLEKSDLFTSEVSLYRQLESDEFVVKYQPIINIKNSKIIGMEALLHWEHPERGFISPRDFIPLADKNTLILPLGKWALSQACLQVKSWHNRNIQPLFVSVNISARHFYLPNLIQIITESLEQNGLSPQSLELDISANTLGKDLDLAKRILIEMRSQGIKICLDDFDINSLPPEHLGQPLFSTIKTPVSLIQNLPSQPEAYDGMEAVLSLSLELGFNVVAKGVETREQLGLIRSLGCEVVQGYLFDPPLIPEDATDVLRANWLGRSDKPIKGVTAPVALP
jgi:EAL domain-containing protein (putative c-di-GMP-specific phosphodiesterase class I)